MANKRRVGGGTEVPARRLLHIHGITRRDFLVGGAAALLLAGCGGAAGSGGANEETSANTRTIEHKYGSTAIEGSPERVVSVGYTDQDPILAAGVRPVGIRNWIGEEPYAVWPWARDELGDAEPELLPVDAINYEQVAALEPDLVIGVSSGMTQEDYDTLSEIAPTPPQSDEWVDFGVPWQDQARVIGRALGREERAEEMISALERRFAETRENNPALEGATVSVIGAGDGLFYVYGPLDRSVRFFDSLGMEVSEEVAEITEGQFSVEISEEQFGLAEADAIICFATTPSDERELRENEIYSGLRAVQDDRVFYLTDSEDPLKGALSFNTVLSHPYLLENFVPTLAETVERA